MRVLSAAVAAIPFVFGAIRGLQTGSDFRYLAAALAALAAAATIFRLGGRLDGGVVSRVLLPFLAVMGATLLAGAVAFGLGARSPVAVWIVAFAFGLCVTASGTLGLFGPSRSR